MKPLNGVQLNDAWLKSDSLQVLFDIVTSKGGEARVAGGAVRNSLLGQAVDDVDLCTTLLPEDVVECMTQHGHKVIPTGIEHGTVTVVINSSPFEVTTLREDIETDGRHAIVRFGKDWERDALRRDLTINGLFCDRNGQVYDFVGGHEDIQSQTIRFIGDAETRIKEDALRILRFFRFFAWYGAGRPEALGLKACAANKALLSDLSAERIWVEIKKLLAAPDPGRALLWARTTGILSALIPETEKWGIDAIPGLIALEQSMGWTADPFVRLMAMIRPDKTVAADLATRMKMSNTESDRLLDWVSSELPTPQITLSEFEKKLYKGSLSGIQDAMRLEVVHLKNREEKEATLSMLSLLEHSENWEKPVFPIAGADLLDAGMESGPAIGKQLTRLEDIWLGSDFRMSKNELLGKVSD